MKAPPTLALGLLLLSSNMLMTSDATSDQLDAWWKTFSTTYTDNPTTEKILKEIEAAYPKLVKVYSLGKTSSGKFDQWAVNLRKDVQSPRPELVPQVQIAANLHGDETVGRSLLLMLIVDLIRKSENGDKIAVSLMEKTDIHLVPSFNPEGYQMLMDGKGKNQNEYCEPESGSDEPQRYNSKFYDLNRNFPDPGNDILEPVQEETKNIMKHFKDHSFVLSATFHGGTWVVNYPYDHAPIREQSFCPNKATPSPVPDNEAIIKWLSKIYAKNHKFMWNSKELIETDGGHTLVSADEKCANNKDFFEDGTVNGGTWYNINGGLQDWVIDNTNSFELTIENSCCKHVAASHLPVEWENNGDALYSLLLASHTGIKGKTGANKKILLENNKHPVRSNSNGEFWRLTLPGKVKYVIVDETQGWSDGTVMEAEAMDVQMLPPKPITTTTSTTTTTKIPPPVSSGSRVKIEMVAVCSIALMTAFLN